ncbi:MAG TPA: oligosaccharide flippase family protein [Vicinamibacterales bacterium]|nr:oligosaccharide flippase family protein [Vicinamibacterales bacterium]
MISRERQVRNTVVYLFPIVVASAIPLATLPIYTRVLSREAYGAWALSLAYAMFITGLANFGLTLGYERNFFEHREGQERSQLLYTTLAFVTGVFVICAVMTWVFRRTLAAAIVGSDSHAALLFCTVCAHAVMSLKVYYLIFFRNTGQARAHAWYSADELIGAAILGVIFVTWLRLGVIGIPLGQLVASLVVLAALTWRFARELPISFSARLLKEELAVSYPLTPRILLGVAGTQIDKYLLALLGTVAGVGVYTVGQRLAQIVFAYMTALENVFTPQIYDNMFKGAPGGGAVIGAFLTPFAYVSTLAALGLGLFAEEAIIVLTPSPYHGAIPIASILCLHYGLMFFGKLPQLMYAKKTGLISVLTFVALTANAVCNILFIRRWGAIGAAAGTLTAGMISITLALIVGQRYYPIRWQYPALAWIFAVLFAGVIGAVWMRDAGIPYLPRLAVKGMALGLYAAVGVQLGILSRANIAIARTALRRRLTVPTP